MSDRDPRAELSGIVRGVRRRLELERAAGTGESLAAAATRAVKAGGKARAQAPAPMAARTPPALAEEESAASSLAIASGTEVDLFGNPVRSATPHPPVEETDPLEGPRAASGLAPAGIAGRATILSSSLSVLETIASEVRACRKCGLCETRTQAVPGVGSAANLPRQQMMRGCRASSWRRR